MLLEKEEKTRGKKTGKRGVKFYITGKENNYLHGKSRKTSKTQL